ncbi:MAG: short-chain dehydrogenase, partial [Polyangiaceae bacterium]
MHRAEEVHRERPPGHVRVVAASREPQSGFETLDVTRADHIDALARHVASEGGLDALVNNAGV